MLMDIIILIAVLGLGGLGWFLFGNKRQKQMKKRIERIQSRKVSIPKTMQESLRRKTTEQKGLVYLLMKPLPDFKKLGDRLERAGKTITPKQYVFRRALTVLAITIVVSVILKKSVILGLSLGIIFGAWLPIKFLQRSINKESKAFLRLFPDAIDLIVRGLRSGLPVSESLVLVSHEVPDPVGSIFGNISNTMKLGVTMEKALIETAKKLELTEFNFFTTSIILQRETGGNLSEILNNLSEVLRNRFIMHMKIKALSSEARASAIIIGALPFVVILAVSILTPEYMTVLWTDYRGNIAAGIAAGMMGSGLWIMNRMTKFEI
jgi:tight adherence protein B